MNHPEKTAEFIATDKLRFAAQFVIREFPAVNFDHPAGGKFIAAYVFGDFEIDIDALNNFIAERKPPKNFPRKLLRRQIQLKLTTTGAAFIRSA